MRNNKSNKEIVLSFYQEVVGKRNTELAKEIIAEDYIQHNPMVKTGLSGVLEAIEYLKQIPIKESSESPLKRIIGEDEYVAVHLFVEVGNVKQVVMDLFRVKGGKLVEHWDAIEIVKPETKNGNSMINGIGKISNHELREENKKIVNQYVQKILIKRKAKKIEEYVHGNLIQHHPGIENGLNGLENYLEGSGEWKIDKVHKIIGEGNFVLVQSKGSMENNDHVFYDLYRLENRKIIEQWSVRQEIPEKMAHNNGMI